MTAQKPSELKPCPKCSDFEEGELVYCLTSDDMVVGSIYKMRDGRQGTYFAKCRDNYFFATSVRTEFYNTKHLHGMTLIKTADLAPPQPEQASVGDRGKALEDLYAEMDRRFDLHKSDDDHLVIDDTQLGVEFAFKFLAPYITTPSADDLAKVRDEAEQKWKLHNPHTNAAHYHEGRLDAFNEIIDNMAKAVG